MTDQGELCSFCNAIAFSDGFSAEALRSSSLFQDGKQVSHLLNCPCSHEKSPPLQGESQTIASLSRNNDRTRT